MQKRHFIDGALIDTTIQDAIKLHSNQNVVGLHMRNKISPDFMKHYWAICKLTECRMEWRALLNQHLDSQVPVPTYLLKSNAMLSWIGFYPYGERVNLYAKRALLKMDISRRKQELVFWKPDGSKVTADPNVWPSLYDR